MDIRSNVTRNRIRLALLACMKNKPFNEILNKDIIKKAQISSRTFYNYYSDKHKILTDIEQHILRGIKQANEADSKNVLSIKHYITSQDNLKLAQKEFKHLVDYCWQIKDIAKVLISANGDINFLNKINRTAREEAKKRFGYLITHKFMATAEKAEIPADMIVNVYVSAIVNILLTWLESDQELSPYQIRRILGEVQVKSPVDLFSLLKKEK